MDTVIESGGEFDQPLRTSFGPVFSSLDCPGKVIHPAGSGACASFQLHHVAPCHSAWHLLTPIHAHMMKCGTGGKGEESTSLAVHRRLVLPAAMAGGRWRSRCAISLPPRTRGETSATRSDVWGRDIRVSQLATIPGGLRGVERASSWPRYGVPARPPHDGRSVEPARYKPCSAALRSPVRGLATWRALLVPRRITCVRRTILCRR
jgi:hypothetical protein